MSRYRRRPEHIYYSTFLTIMSTALYRKRENQYFIQLRQVNFGQYSELQNRNFMVLYRQKGWYQCTGKIQSKSSNLSKEESRKSVLRVIGKQLDGRFKRSIGRRIWTEKEGFQNFKTVFWEKNPMDGSGDNSEKKKRRKDRKEDSEGNRKRNSRRIPVGFRKAGKESEKRFKKESRGNSLRKHPREHFKEAIQKSVQKGKT